MVNTAEFTEKVGRSTRPHDVTSDMTLTSTATAVMSCEIHSGLNGTAPAFCPNLFAFPLLLIVPPLLHTHLRHPSRFAISMSRQRIIISTVCICDAARIGKIPPEKELLVTQSSPRYSHQRGTRHLVPQVVAEANDIQKWSVIENSDKKSSISCRETWQKTLDLDGKTMLKLVFEN
jgi:hypothetical protein